MNPFNHAVDGLGIGTFPHDQTIKIGNRSACCSFAVTVMQNPRYACASEGGWGVGGGASGAGAC